ncbi:hypothetical protein MPSEU_000842500 [Mayamaea pseudoterrestris]|nr:hypothetical protein MPSEU_000842500 [Mayamaea pseudoterrestris]
MDLDKLFSLTDYQLTPVALQTVHASSSMHVWCSRQASTDYYLTGQVLWPVSILTSHYLMHVCQQQNDDNKSQWHDKTIVELGAGGTALPSLIAAQCSRANTIVATDGNDDFVLELLRKNVDYFNNDQRQGASSAATSIESTAATAATATAIELRTQLLAKQLVWGNGAQIQALLHEIKAVDIVVAADVVQWPAVIEPLLHTVKALLWRNSHCQQREQAHEQAQDQQQSPPVFILGIVNRASSTYDMFFRLARQLGFKWRQVHASEYLQDGIVPKSCQEFGGRATEIVELTLRTDQTDVPVLLAVDGKAPNVKTTGTGYESTLALPC